MGVFTSTANASLGSNAASTSVINLMSANASVRGRMVVNETTTGIMYLKFGSLASVTSYTVSVRPGQLYEFPQPCYAGVVSAIWSVADGFARWTQW